jgi:hypothetical protein
MNRLHKIGCMKMCVFVSKIDTNLEAQTCMLNDVTLVACDVTMSVKVCVTRSCSPTDMSQCYDA